MPVTNLQRPVGEIIKSILIVFIIYKLPLTCSLITLSKTILPEQNTSVATESSKYEENTGDDPGYGKEGNQNSVD